MPSSQPSSPAPSAPTPSSMKPISISLGKGKTSTNTSSVKLPKPTANGTRPAPSSLLPHHNSDSEDESRAPRHEAVTHVDTAGATNGLRKQEEEKKLVIKTVGNRDWRKRGRNLLPKEVQAARAREAAAGGGVENASANVETIEVAKEGGLKFAQKTTPAENEMQNGSQDVEMQDATSSGAAAPARVPKTDDELALAALLADKGSRKSDLILPMRIDELSVYRSDVSSRPDPASLADYAAVPVEEFGAALLRGMGWKEGEEYGTKRKNRYAGPDGDDGAAKKKAKKDVEERRPAFLGIGAKAEAANGGVELGAWGKSDMRRAASGKKDGAGLGEGLYNPVMLRDKRTGEMVSEEELKLRKLEALEGPKDSQSDREKKRRRDDNGDRKGREGKDNRDRERSRDRDREKRKDRDFGRDRDTEKDKDRRKNRDYDDELRDERRYRDKERDRRKRYADEDRYDSASSSRKGRRDREKEYETERERDGRRDHRKRDIERRREAYDDRDPDRNRDRERDRRR